MKKRPFTLLELMVGIALASLLLIFLFSTLKQSTFANSKMKVAQKLVHQRLCTQLRLTSVFDALEFERQKIGFYTASHAESLSDVLYFSYHQEVDADPNFIGVLEAMLFLKHPEKKLCLYTTGANGSMRKEVLLENLKTISFLFLDTQKGEWKSDWSKEADFAPGLVKLLITEKDKNPLKDAIEFGFQLKNASEIIYFKEAGK